MELRTKEKPCCEQGYGEERNRKRTGWNFRRFLFDCQVNPDITGAALAGVMLLIVLVVKGVVR